MTVDYQIKDEKLQYDQLYHQAKLASISYW